MSWGEGAWWTTVHGAAKESDTTEQLNIAAKKHSVQGRCFYYLW